MIKGLRLGVALVAIAGISSLGPVTEEAAASCDPAYVNYCIPPVYEVGDLNCDDLYSQGISWIQLASPYNDPHGLDGWNYVDDGWGCEGY